MRTISAADDALHTAIGGRAVFHRVKVKDAGGTFRDLSTYGPYNMCVSADWEESIDGPGLEATIQLKREVEQWSLAPLKAASPFNLGLAFPGSYAPLIDVSREIQIDVAVVPDGTPPVSGDWKLAFHGYIDDTDPAAGELLTLKCSDQQALLRDTPIERERSYAHAQGGSATKGCQIWRPSDGVLSTGLLAIPSEANRNGHFYAVDSITTGITGSTEPVWPTSAGGTVVDGGVTWKEKGSTSQTAGTAVETVMQQIIDDNLGAGVFTLNVPASPSWSIKAYKQDRVSVWDALRKLADQIGWDLRFRWDSGSSSFKLTLLQPDRAKTTADRTFTPSARYPLQSMPTSVQWIRNAIRVWYSDSGDLDASQRPKRKFYEATSSSSITAYRRRFMEISEASASNIDSATEAQRLAEACRDDLCLPIADHVCEVPFFRFVELQDLIQWNGDGLHYDSNQKLAVVSYRHRVTAGERPTARTTITTRGKPSAGMRHWLEKGSADNDHAFDLGNGGGLTVTTSDVVGGKLIKVAGRENKDALAMETEIHVSDSSGFTPSSSTLAQQAAANQVVVSDLIPGKTYYVKVRPYGRNRSRIVLAHPSVEQSFVAGRASAGHVHGGIAIGDYPLNGGFETRLDVGGMPDHWTIINGTYNTHWIVKEDGNGVSGDRYIRLTSRAVGDTELQSARLPLVNEAGEANRYSQIYRVTAWVKNDSGNASANKELLFLTFYDYAGVQQAISGSLLLDVGSKKGHWQKVELAPIALQADADIRSMVISLYSNAGAVYTVDVDEVRIQCLGSPWYEIGDTSKFTENYESIPGFQNSWANTGGSNQVARFRKNAVGRVFVQGLCNTGSSGTVAFTLPVGFRPPADLTFSNITSGPAFAATIVTTNGDVTLYRSGTNVGFDFSFETF